MKKLFLAIAVLVALALGAVPAQALMGMPDDVPGCDVLQPFFVVSMPGHGNTNTILVFTDVWGAWPAAAGAVFHYDVLTRQSVTVFNDYIAGTNYDIVPTDALSIISLMAPTELAKLEIDLDGDGTNDHWAGYIYFENLYWPANNVIAQTLLVNLAAGMASSANVPAKEVCFNVPPIMATNWMVEAFSANALATAESLQAGGGVMGASGFALYPRYYIVDAAGKSYIIIWKSANWPAPNVHIWFFNADEKYVSSNLPLPYELNIIDIEQFLPVTLHSGYPKEGWLLIGLPDIYGFPPAVAFGDWEWLGYTWNMATGGAGESWTTLNPIHREVLWP